MADRKQRQKQIPFGDDKHKGKDNQKGKDNGNSRFP